MKWSILVFSAFFLPVFISLSTVTSCMSMSLCETGRGDIQFEVKDSQKTYSDITVIAQKYGASSRNFTLTINPKNKKSHIQSEFSINISSAAQFVMEMTQLPGVTYSNYRRDIMSDESSYQKKLEELEKEIPMLENMLVRTPVIAALISDQKKSLLSNIESAPMCSSSKISVSISMIGYTTKPFITSGTKKFFGPLIVFVLPVILIIAGFLIGRRFKIIKT